MSAAETIAKAVEKLEGLRSSSDEGDVPRVWRVRPIGPLDQADVLDDVDNVIVERCYAEDAHLIVTLRRTIDAQLAILRHALEAGLVAFDGHTVVSTDAVDLAEAILGGDA